DQPLHVVGINVRFLSIRHFGIGTDSTPRGGAVRGLHRTLVHAERVDPELRLLLLLQLEQRPDRPRSGLREMAWERWSGRDRYVARLPGDAIEPGGDGGIPRQGEPAFGGDGGGGGGGARRRWG